MISTAEPVPSEVRLERIRMALAEVGAAPEAVWIEDGCAVFEADVISRPTAWRAQQITRPTLIYCFKCWEADDCNTAPGLFARTCVAPVGVYDCGRSDRP